MATRTLIIDLSKGTGGEPMYGMVTVQRTRATSEGTFEVLPWETKLKLFNGVATITEAVTDGSGPFYDSAYLIRVQNGYCAPRWGFMTALPDGTTPISTGDMPKVNPITGEGIYMDAQEWNALYGTLPNRVTSLEDSQAVQDTRIGELEVEIISKGDASMRVDRTAGTRVYVSAGNDEEQVKGETGWRDVSSWLPAGCVGTLQVNRVGNEIKASLQLTEIPTSNSTATEPIPIGFRSSNNRLTYPLINYGDAVNLGAFALNGIRITIYDPLTKPAGIIGLNFSWFTIDAWPTTLPGTPA